MKVSKEAENLYKSGMSVYQVAARFNIKPNTVICHMRDIKLLRPNTGKYAEDIVEKYLFKSKIPYERQKGDAPFDFLIRNKKVDVKSARLSKNDKSGNLYLYKFNLKNKSQEKKDISKSCDVLWLYFRDENMLASLESKYVGNKYCLSFPSKPFTSKIYSLSLIEYF